MNRIGFEGSLPSGSSPTDWLGKPEGVGGGSPGFCATVEVLESAMYHLLTVHSPIKSLSVQSNSF